MSTRTAGLLLAGIAACGPADRAPTRGADGGDATDAGAGCTAEGLVCIGNVVHACDVDGTGPVVEVCDDRCLAGECTSSCGVDGVDKIFLVSSGLGVAAPLLYRFDPDLLPASGTADPAFLEIGPLDCPAGPEYGGAVPRATPYSMAVDRLGRAWVLYRSGEMFRVSVTDAGCEATGFVRGQVGFELFGMGFASDAVGGDAETLYVAGGRALGLETVGFGTIDTETLAVAPRAVVPRANAVPPELTGTGAAELWGYFPGGPLHPAWVARLDRASAALSAEVEMPAVDSAPRAWAFAHHGGRFYAFTTRDASLSSGVQGPAVEVVDPALGVIARYPTTYRIVGAGVSTCAPTTQVE